MTPEEADRNAIIKRREPANDNASNSLPRRNTEALVPVDTMRQAKRELATCLYRIHEPISLIFLVGEAARESVYVRLAFDLSDDYDTELVSEQKLAELSENDTALWNFLRDIIEGKITFAGRKLTVVRSEPELMVEVKEPPMSPSEELASRISTSSNTMA